jgi:transposase
MPARIDCPVSRDDLAMLYEAETSTQLAKRFGVNKSLVINWLRRYEIPRRKFSPYTANKIDCPFSPGRLKELYWRDGLSLQEIADRAADVVGRSVSWSTVKNWLTAADIPTRTPAQWLKLRSQKAPQRWSEHAKQHLTPGVVGMPNGPSRQTRRKGQLAAAKAKHEAALETRECAYCGKLITRIRSRFRQPPEQTYCNRSCADKALKPKLEVRYCAWCGATVVRRPFEFRRDEYHTFCSKSHAAKARALDKKTQE